MRKLLILVLALIFPFLSFTQEKAKKRFSHTIAQNYGVIVQFQLGPNIITPSIDGTNYKFLNLIPSYEFGFNNMFFAKLKFRNLRNHYYMSYYSQETDYLDAYSVIFTYNILRKHKTRMLQVGTGYSLMHIHSKNTYIDQYGNKPSVEYAEDFKFHHFIIAISSTQKITQNFGVGIEINLYDIIFFRDYSLFLSYTF